jgi:predicted alpha/beta superfamily hydrolase
LLAASFGATFVSPSILAMESRIRTAVLMSSSLAAIDPRVFPAVVNPNTYWPRVTMPVLLLNGNYDISIHVTKSRDLLLQSIGATADKKRGVLYDAPHWPLPPHRVRDDTLAWFDQHLGSAN